MNINPTMNLNFSSRAYANNIKKLTTFRVPGKDGTTVVTDIIETGVSEKLTNLEYKVMQKVKCLKDVHIKIKKDLHRKDFVASVKKFKTK